MPKSNKPSTKKIKSMSGCQGCKLGAEWWDICWFGEECAKPTEIQGGEECAKPTEIQGGEECAKPTEIQGGEDLDRELGVWLLGVVVPDVFVVRAKRHARFCSLRGLQKRRDARGAR